MSPHARLYVDVKDERGEVVNWNLELPSPNTLMCRGWKRDSLKLGDYVKVNASPARNFPAIAIATPSGTATTRRFLPARRRCTYRRSSTKG